MDKIKELQMLVDAYREEREHMLSRIEIFMSDLRRCKERLKAPVVSVNSIFVSMKKETPKNE